MKKLRLLAVRSQQEALLRELMVLGCVQISDPEPLLEDPEYAPLLHRGESETMRRRADHTELLHGVKLLDQYAPVKKKLLSAKPLVSRETLLDEEKLADAVALAKSLDVKDDQIRRITVDESYQRSVVESMLPWSGLDIPLESEGTASCCVLLGTLPASLELGEVSRALDEAAPESQLYSVSTGPEQHYVSVICLRAEEAAATEALREKGFSPLAANGLRGTPREIISEAERKLEALAQEKAALSEEIAMCAPSREEMQLCADRMGLLVDRAEAADKLVGTEGAVVLTGWIPAPEEERLAGALAKFDCAWETEDPDPDKPEEVPIKLKNNRVTEPYTMITEMYSLPSYKGLDPNPFIMPAFALFFGIMFADMAYGLILFLAGMIVLKKMRPKGGTKNLMGLCVQCGIATFIMGFLTGGFFGDAVHVVGTIFGQDWTLVPQFGTIRIGEIAIALPLNLLEGNNPLYVLIAAMALGVVHLAIGVGIGCYLKFRDGEWLDAVLNDLSWWVMFVGLAVMILGGTKIILFVGIAMMVVGAFLSGKGFGRITKIFSAVYNGVTGYLGDILSYSRLMALMLAGSVIASVFNQLGSLGGIALFIPVFLIGHTLNFGLNVIGCFVHTMRLQFLEFFGKWYRDGGIPFRPLQMQTKFVDIKED